MLVAIKPAPTTAPKEKFVLAEDERETVSSSWNIDLKKWADVAEQASLDAQAELHKQGLSYVIGRDGALFEVLPGGKEIEIAATHKI